MPDPTGIPPAGAEPTRDWADAFLEALREKRDVTYACARAGIKSRSTAYGFKRLSPTFAAAWEDAMEIHVDNLEATAMERATDGWLEPVFHNGASCGSVRKFSTGLTIFMLKAHRPKIYRFDRNETGAGDQTPTQISAAILALFNQARATVPDPPPKDDGA